MGLIHLTTEDTEGHGGGQEFECKRLLTSAICCETIPTMSYSSGYRPNGFKSTGLTIFAVAVVLSSTTFQAQDTEKHFPTQDGAIRIEVSGASFQIPNDWAVYSERAELEKVKNGKGEWKTEYTKIANAALPFSDCSIQVAKWAWIVSTFAGVTVRGYVVNRSAAELDTTIATKALHAAKALPSSSVHNASITKEKADQWHRILVAYDVWYGDYGGRANVDFYTTEKNGKTIALVFMYVDMDNNRATVQQILRSFAW